MFEVGTIDFAVYEGDDEFVGMASVTLPDKIQKTMTVNGAGIGGDVEVPVKSQYEAMSLTVAFKNYSPRVARLRQHGRHNIELRVAQQDEDPVAGQLVTAAVKHVFSLVPKSATGGNIAPATAGDMTITFSVRSWRTSYDGVLVDEIDQFNRVDIVNGIDFNADVRRALGK